jgi:NitT/TauT family transport system substrate-binding protein
MIYNEYAQVLETIDPRTGELYQPEDLTVIDYNDVGTAMLQDGIWARESWLAEEGNEDVATRFLSATFKGWQHCRDDPDDCVRIVTENGSILGAGHQAWMMNEINSLVWPSAEGLGAMPQETWDRTVEIMLESGIIGNDPGSSLYRTDLADAARASVEGDLPSEGHEKSVIQVTLGGK